MQHEELVRYIHESTESVFSTMLGLDVRTGPSDVSCGAVAPSLVTPTVSFEDTAVASPSRGSFRPLPV